MHLKVVQQAVVATTPCDAPLALTQLALIFTKRLWSRASSAERSPTCSTLTMLPLRPRTLMGEGLERSSVGNLTEVVRLPMVAVFFWRWWWYHEPKLGAGGRKWNRDTLLSHTLPHLVDTDDDDDDAARR